MTHTETFNQYRPLLFSIAYRMVGSAMDAEDLVQETFLRWQSQTLAEIESPKAYLTTIISRLCVDYLRSTKVQRETYVGSWLPEPVLTESLSAQPDDLVALSESLSMAFLVLLESLSPTERAVFLLREVFDYDYPTIAEIVGKSQANCRQMFRRARQHITARRPRFQPKTEQPEQLAQQFLHTCLNGDMQGLMSLLADDVIFYSDGGGNVLSAINPIYGVDKVGRFLEALFRKAPDNTQLKPAIINGQPGFLTYIEEQLFNVAILDITAGQIQNIYMVLNPNKLQHLQGNIEFP